MQKGRGVCRLDIWQQTDPAHTEERNIPPHTGKEPGFFKMFFL